MDDNSKNSQTEHKNFLKGKIVNRGIHFPVFAVFLLLVGLASEVVDAIFLTGVLDQINSDIPTELNALISGIVGITCFASMAFVGYQRANRKLTGLEERWGYFTWLAAGLTLVVVRIWALGLSKLVLGGGSMSDGGLSEYEVTELTRAVTLAIVQFVLYIGTGFLSRDSAEIVFDSDIWEYRKATKQMLAIQDEIAERRKELKDGLAILQVYPQYAERLTKSKESVRDNIAQYNESTRAMIEAKMGVEAEPELMTDMYDSAMRKESSHK